MASIVATFKAVFGTRSWEEEEGEGEGGGPSLPHDCQHHPRRQRQKEKKKKKGKENQLALPPVRASARLKVLTPCSP